MTRWRKIASPIILLVVATLLFLGVRWGYKQLTRPFGQEAPPCVEQSSSTLDSSQVWVRVMNTGKSNGLAGEVTDQFKQAGFNTFPARNSSEEESGTVVVGGSADSPEVKLVQGFLIDAEARGDGRKDGTVTVLLDDNYPGFNAESPRSIEAPGGKICVAAPQETPTPRP
ncbi:hypothetical protein HMPREF9306_00241 [Propionimicrobium lymphophilum ACS-093-V-SCH5]|uniref:LytR/CpsA/Psr regulator C-terminal domain-containing protein n=1 Tax=Propionimicrobium lymphophilum ACS-093-V-SCH5 TaxID=883161 RepID=S2W3U4_9ACTN|nr:LytR C-terminal domain-containing protein [Propionimicrobium lymphophilum]EPD33826.1 hypothetical protein HMPREF9306_00241 [Propionimicrobium lymphophilum ACS-093-V-SCH5]